MRVSRAEQTREESVEHGRVVDAGTHEELLARPGTYRELWSVQQLA
jgi:ABC-type multidrug transport system fused ATPase/permease subunit